MNAPESVAGVEPGVRIQERYQVRSLLGKGGFASVFRAYDIDIERHVAVKVLNLQVLTSGDGDSEVMLERFRREAKLAARISHPSVVQIHDYGVLEATDNPFIIMEVLEGHDLEEEIQEEGSLEAGRFLPLFIEALEALGEAHKLGIVHKDLKPSNLFVADPGHRRERLKVVDFGIAHIGGEAGDERLTRTGFMLGTPQYMAPEYVEEQRVSPALDVYQMALILVEMLAGRAVVDDTNPWKCAMRHVGRELSIPGPLLESPLGPVIERGLALNPEERYLDAAAFADALDALDVEAIPRIDPDAEWLPLPELPPEERSVPDEETQRLFNEAQTARRSISELAEGAAELAESDEEVEEGDAEAEEWDTEAALRSLEPGGRRGVFVALAVLAFAVVVAAVIFVGDGESDRPEESVEETVADAEDESAVVDDDEEMETEGQEAPAEEGIGQAESGREVELRIRPEDAFIEVDGEAVGEKGTARLQFSTPTSEARNVVVTHEDYETFDEEIGPEAGPVFELELTRHGEEAPEPDPEPTPDEGSEAEATSQPMDEAETATELPQETDVEADEVDPGDGVASKEESGEEGGEDDDDESTEDPAVLVAP